MDIDIQHTKIELIQWLTTLEDRAIIQKIVDLRKNETKDWWSKTSDAEKKSVNQGLADAEQGKLKPNSDAIDIYGKWL